MAPALEVEVKVDPELGLLPEDADVVVLALLVTAEGDIDASAALSLASSG